MPRGANGAAGDTGCTCVFSRSLASRMAFSLISAPRWPNGATKRIVKLVEPGDWWLVLRREVPFCGWTGIEHAESGPCRPRAPILAAAWQELSVGSGRECWVRIGAWERCSGALVWAECSDPGGGAVTERQGRTKALGWCSGALTNVVHTPPTPTLWTNPQLLRRRPRERGGRYRPTWFTPRQPPLSDAACSFTTCLTASFTVCAVCSFTSGVRTSVTGRGRWSGSARPRMPGACGSMLVWGLGFWHRGLSTTGRSVSRSPWSAPGGVAGSTRRRR